MYDHNHNAFVAWIHMIFQYYCRNNHMKINEIPATISHQRVK